MKPACLVHPVARLAAGLARLPKARCGIAATETALILPFFMGVGLCGIELANYSLTIMRVGQIAVQVADNASRIGDISTLENRKIYEGDIDDLLLGAGLQAGEAMDLYGRGRVIVSSLEVNSDDAQYVHWQRCLGKLQKDSSYGLAGDVLPSGMGPEGREVTAQDGDAVIFVEVHYRYRSLIADALLGERDITTTASFTVRTSRDLSQIYQSDSSAPAPIASCTNYTDSLT